MNIWMKRCLEAGAIAGGLWVLGSGLASAQDLNHGAPSVLNAPVTAPVTVSGNAVAVLGHSRATSTTASANSAPTTTPPAHRSLISAPVTAPVTICGNAVGRASASCGATGSSGSSGNGSNAVIATPISAPVAVCGNAAGVLGKAAAACPAAGTSAGSTSGTGSSAGGLSAPVSTPVTVCGNGVGLLGSASANCSGTGSTPPVTGGSSGPGTPTQPVISQSVEGTSTSRARGLGALSLAGQPVSARALAFTGSSLAMLKWLAVSLLVAGLALTVGWRRRTA